MGTTDKSPLHAGVSLAGFVVSGLIFGQLGGHIGKSVFLKRRSLAKTFTGHRRRDWLLFNFAAQVGVLIANVVIVAPGVSRRLQPEGDLGWVYLLLLAVQGGIQVTQVCF